MKKKNIILKIIGSGGLLAGAGFLIIIICVLMIFDFFGTKLTKTDVQDNVQYASAYKDIANKYLTNGYVPLQRLLYFYLEDSSLSLDTLYTMNLDIDAKTARDIESVCEDLRVKDMNACSDESIKENQDYLIVNTGRFNLPLKNSFTITSFFNQQRIIYGKSNLHGGWDFSVPAQTPVFSVCNGVVEKVKFTQSENVPYNKSGNSVGNTITIKCDEDYEEDYYVIFAHLYPNSSKVSVGDRVSHWTEIASVGTTGYSTGNHLHYQVENSNREKLDGMHFIDFNLSTEYFPNKN